MSPSVPPTSASPDARSPLDALTPLDGRYAPLVEPLAALTSEAALHRQRVRVEAHWMLHLAELQAFGAGLLSKPERALLEKLAADGCDLTGARRIAAIETTTRHDVKAVEYWMREQLMEVGAQPATLAMVHFACTSEDINNLAWALMVRDVRAEIFLPLMNSIEDDLALLVQRAARVPLLSLTHGQPATPTTLGKELAVFGARLVRCRRQLERQEICGKINGATGNFNAHTLAAPSLDWMAVSRSFVQNRLGLTWNPLTTQIENHDWLAETTDVLRRWSVVSIGLCRDMWGYVSRGIFRQKLKSGEVGSSTMPHKVNPIDFENAEGNLGLAAALCGHFSEKLPISRFQRDLSDSTVLRSFGTLAGHLVVAMASLRRGLSRVEEDPARAAAELAGAWEVLGEGVQTLLRVHGVVDAYERLKAATRGAGVNQADLEALIAASPELSEESRKRLLTLEPSTWTGLAPELAQHWLNTRRK